MSLLLEAGSRGTKTTAEQTDHQDMVRSARRGFQAGSVLPVIGGLHERGPTVDAVSFVHVCILLHHQLDHL